MNHIRNLRYIGNVEGVSYLALLGIAAPLKYLNDMPSHRDREALSIAFFLYCLCWL
jgi:hypothetical protein